METKYGPSEQVGDYIRVYWHIWETEFFSASMSGECIGRLAGPPECHMSDDMAHGEISVWMALVEAPCKLGDTFFMADAFWNPESKQWRIDLSINDNNILGIRKSRVPGDWDPPREK